MKDIKIIALCGHKGCGKTTAKDYMTIFGYVHLRFANKLKEMLDVLGVSREYIDGDKKEEPCELLCGKTARHAMQTLGTEWGRVLIGESLWIKQVQKHLLKSIDMGLKTFVIDDLRFPNEEMWLKKNLMSAPYNYDVKIIRIKRDEADKVSKDHVSEQMIDDIVEDWTVFNNGTKESMFSSLDDIIFGRK